MVNKKGLLERYRRLPLAPGKSVAKTASKALYIAATVAKSLNVEKKYKDTTTSSAMSGTAIVTCANGVAQGDSGITRDGSQIKILSMNLKGRISNNQANSDWYRFLVVLDKQADGTAPTWAELTEDNDWYSFNNMNNKMRFSTLYEETFFLEAAGRRDSKVINHRIDFSKIFKKAQGLRVRYSGTGNAVSDIASNPVYFIVFNRSGTASGSTLEMRSRIRFVDN